MEFNRAYGNGRMLLSITNTVKVTVKVKLHLCFNCAPRHQGVLEDLRYSSTHSLTRELDGGEWSASRLGRFTTTERASCTHWIGGRVGPRVVLDAVVKRKIPNLCRKLNPRTRIVQPVASRYGSRIRRFNTADAMVSQPYMILDKMNPVYILRTHFLKTNI